MCTTFAGQRFSYWQHQPVEGRQLCLVEWFVYQNGVRSMWLEYFARRQWSISVRWQSNTERKPRLQLPGRLQRLPRWTLDRRRLAARLWSRWWHEYTGLDDYRSMVDVEQHVQKWPSYGIRWLENFGSVWYVLFRGWYHFWVGRLRRSHEHVARNCFTWFKIPTNDDHTTVLVQKIGFNTNVQKINKI